MDINEDFLEVLACPGCKGDLIQDDDVLECEECGEYYEIIEGIPSFL